MVVGPMAFWANANPLIVAPSVELTFGCSWRSLIQPDLWTGWVASRYRPPNVEFEACWARNPVQSRMLTPIGVQPTRLSTPFDRLLRPLDKVCGSFKMGDGRTPRPTGGFDSFLPSTENPKSGHLRFVLPSPLAGGCGVEGHAAKPNRRAWSSCAKSPLWRSTTAARIQSAHLPGAQLESSPAGLQHGLPLGPGVCGNGAADDPGQRRCCLGILPDFKRRG